MERVEEEGDGSAISKKLEKEGGSLEVRSKDGRRKERRNEERGRKRGGNEGRKREGKRRERRIKEKGRKVERKVKTWEKKRE